MTVTDKPILFYDGDCGFCRRWILKWQRLTKEAVRYEAYQEADPKTLPVSREKLERSVWFVEPGGRVSSAAEAVFRALACRGVWRWPLWLYLHLPPFRRVSEKFYSWVAGNRMLFSRWSGPACAYGEKETYFFSKEIFLRVLGAVYFLAFASLALQVTGLFGARGIWPVAQMTESLGQWFGAKGFWAFPSVFWWNADDAFLRFIAWAGAVLALFLAVGRATTAWTAAVLWFLYLSICSVGGDFLAFQWDALLLEAGLLGVFLAPPRWIPRHRQSDPPSRLVVALYQWLLFRVLFSSGLVKLLSGDTAWRQLTALEFHYETQPLPHILSWFVHQLPPVVHHGSVVLLFAAELAVPVLLFAKGRLRLAAFWASLGLQCLILLTGNYGFFNLLTMALCLFFIEDAVWIRWFPFLETTRGRWRHHPKTRPWPGWIAVPLFAVFLTVSGFVFFEQFRIPVPWPEPVRRLAGAASATRSFNRYGLFAVMTTRRMEIVVEGSSDGKIWQPYEFHYKPGDPARPPAWAQPHQPRLDWQMWFAALSPYQSNSWYISFLKRLLEGRPEVLKLLKHNPFEERPPKYVRGVYYRYRFSDFQTQRTDRVWWTRERKGLYSPPMALAAEEP